MEFFKKKKTDNLVKMKTIMLKAGNRSKAVLLSIMFISVFSLASAQNISIKINKRFLNSPISQKVDRKKMTFEVDGKPERSFVIRLANAEPEYWVFCDVTALKGKTLKINYEGDASGLKKIYQADEINGQDSVYKEENRPQFHFTTKRG